MITINKWSLAGVIGLTALAGGIIGLTAKTRLTKAAEAVPAVQIESQKPGKDPSQGGHVGANGVKEVLLTGDDAEKAKTAALSAVPGGTIERLETDAEGWPYEAHMKKADGSRVTVKFDNEFKMTSIEEARK